MRLHPQSNTRWIATAVVFALVGTAAVVRGMWQPAEADPVVYAAADQATRAEVPLPDRPLTDAEVEAILRSE